MVSRSEILALMSQIEELARLADGLDDPVIDMLIAKARQELARILDSMAD